MAIPNEETFDRPSCVSYISGRVFYGFKDRIFYSQVLQQNQYFYLSRCYQQNDPTSETNSDSYPTDGGVIPIDDASGINTITPFRGGAFVTATNGCWLISGSNGVFTSDDFTVVKLSDDGCISPKSLVSAFSNIMYWGRAGIYMTTVNEYGETSVQTLSKNVIQSVFDKVDGDNLKNVKGILNKAKKQVEWLIPEGDSPNFKTKSVTLDLNTESFWVHEYMGADYVLVGAFSTNSTKEDDSVVYITPKHDPDGGLGATDELLQVQLSLRTCSEFVDCDSPYKTAYLETAPANLGKQGNKKSSPYIGVSFLRTEGVRTDTGYDYPSSCVLQLKWDYNRFSNTQAKWQNTQQCYRLKDKSDDISGAIVDAEEVVYYKARCRGRGQAVTFRFEQEQNKDFQLLGYAVDYQMKSRM